MFVEHHGNGTGASAPPVGDLVMLTSGSRLRANSLPLDGVTIRYMAKGAGVYHIGGRTFRLCEGQFLIADQGQGAEIEIPVSGGVATLALCAFIAANDESYPSRLPGPIVLGEACSPVGAIMRDSLRSMRGPVAKKSASAACLATSLRALLPNLIDDLSGHALRIGAVKASTRFDALRKVEIARAFLHSALDRSVPLEELARVAGMSRFHLLRAFQDCRGDTPAAYHRRLRLVRAVDEAKRRGASLESIACEFGFASGSSLSHAHRRAFGHSPQGARAAG